MVVVKELSQGEVANHSQGKDLWACIRGYGKDATEAFEDAAHSEEVTTIMKELIVGKVPSLQPKAASTTQRPTEASPIQETKSQLERSRGGKSTRDRAKLFLVVSITAPVALRLVAVAPILAFFVVIGVSIPLAVSVNIVIVVTPRHQAVEDYAGYIKSNLAS
ncbi:cytochrome b5 [Bipolaris maydis]|uniref:cytochrome b5 n=1 Tax=Cochliobolus heterostrophus TaxID=5016 RepID=UPI0024D9399E|nr:cytochrome b5 [Bipolaris maydis]KAJ6267262.1 cytochrome b5 [Bipolaris maydis]KAJ6277883.1 cytochrome b5 [Bipolaris maydis]